MRGTTRGASPDRAHPGLHSEPLDAAIGRVPAPYLHIAQAAVMVDEFVETTLNSNITQLLASNYGTFDR